MSTGGSLLAAARRRTASAGGGLLFSPALWLDADELTGLSDGDPVGSFTDLSGNGRHATATSTERPVFKPAIVNGKAVLRFDGSDDFLATSSFAFESFFVVAKYSSATFGNYDGLLSGPTGGDMIYTGEPGQAQWYNTGIVSTYHKNGVSMAKNATNAAPMNAFAVLYGEGSANFTLQIGKDRSDARFWVGDVAFVAAYASVLSSGDIEAVEDYLGAKYGITITH